MDCRGATAVCIATPARTYRVFPKGESAVLCDSCVRYLREMGLDISEEMPEWRRRLTARDNTGAILTGARR